MTTPNWIEASALSIDDVLKVLPHRYPFLLIDKVTEIKTSVPLRVGMSQEEVDAARPGSYAKAIKNVTYNEMQFMGHFPEMPIFPGVLTMEAMAQAGAFVTVPFLAVAFGGRLPKLSTALAGFDRVRFRKPIRPGDQLEICVTVKSCRGQMWSFDGEVLVDGKRAAEGSFLAHLSTDKPIGDLK